MFIPPLLLPDNDNKAIRPAPPNCGVQRLAVLQVTDAMCVPYAWTTRREKELIVLRALCNDIGQGQPVRWVHVPTRDIKEERKKHRECTKR